MSCTGHKSNQQKAAQIKRKLAQKIRIFFTSPAVTAAAAVLVAAAAALASRAKRNERKLEISWHCHCRCRCCCCFCCFYRSLFLCFSTSVFPQVWPPSLPLHTWGTGTMRSNRKFFGPSLSYSKLGILFWFFVVRLLSVLSSPYQRIHVLHLCFVTAVIMAKLPINPTTFSLYLYNKNTLTFHFYYYFWRKMYKYNKKYRRHRYFCVFALHAYSTIDIKAQVLPYCRFLFERKKT